MHFPTENSLGDAEAMHFRRTVVDTECTQVGEDPRDDRFVGDALAAEYLHAAIDDAPGRFGHDDFRATRFVKSELSVVEHPRTVPDGETRDMEIHVVVGDHEANPFVLADRLAERVAPARIVDGDVMRAACRAEPAHAVREAGGRQSHLRVFETLAYFAEH